jgi:hypothetical protein
MRNRKPQPKAPFFDLQHKDGLAGKIRRFITRHGLQPKAGNWILTPCLQAVIKLNISAFSRWMLSNSKQFPF